MIVKRKGNRVIVDGEGVNQGDRQDMNVEIISDDSDLIFCEIPDLTETFGFQEIINAFALDSILSANKLKILLVVTESDYNINRMGSLRHYINVLGNLFPNCDQLKSGISLVVAHCDPEIIGNDYPDLINEKYERYGKPDSFFLDELHVFTFPKPSKRHIGKEYAFDDHDKIISFLKENPIVSSKHNISLSERARLELIKIKDKDYENNKMIQNDAHLFTTT